MRAIYIEISRNGLAPCRSRGVGAYRSPHAFPPMTMFETSALACVQGMTSRGKSTILEQSWMQFTRYLAPSLFWYGRPGEGEDYLSGLLQRLEADKGTASQFGNSHLTCRNRLSGHMPITLRW